MGVVLLGYQNFITMEYQNKNNLAVRILHFPIVKIIIGIFTCILSTFLVKQFITKPLFSSIISSDTMVMVVVTLLGTLVMTATYYYLFKYYEKRTITELSFKPAIKELLGGFGLGLVVIALEFLILYLFGFYKITSFEGLQLFLAPLGFLIGAAMLEEIMFRGVLYRIMENWQGTIVALLVSAVLFELPHLMNPNGSVFGSITGVIFGLVTGIMYTYTKRLWLPFSFHLGWNLAQPIFGSNITGVDRFGVVFNAELKGDVLLTGTAMGIEDSILSVFTLIILFVIFYRGSIRNKNFQKRV